MSFLFWLFFAQNIALGQNFSEQNFALVLEGHSIKDSTITYSELSKFPKVTSNFSWLLVNDLNISYGGQCYGGNGYIDFFCKSNLICREAILPKRVFGSPGSFIVISSFNTTDKSGRKVPIKPIVLWLKE